MTRSLTATPDLGPTWQQRGTIVTAADTQLGSIYWPWLVDMRTVDPSWAGSTYRMYYSTNHDLGQGGIAYAEADAVEGPWTHHPVIYVDTVTGKQTETPSVVWVPETGCWHLYYQQILIPSGNQATFLSISTDGLTGWSAPQQVLYPPAGFPAPWHTGYLVPMRLPGGKWIGYHLLCGGNAPSFGASWSDDGIEWRTDPRPLGYGQHLLDGYGDRRLEWDTGYLVEHRGRLSWIGMVSSWASGAAARSCYIAQAPIGPDLRTLLARPVAVCGPADYRCLHAHTDADDRTWLIVQEADELSLWEAV